MLLETVMEAKLKHRRNVVRTLAPPLYDTMILEFFSNVVAAIVNGSL